MIVAMYFWYDFLWNRDPISKSSIELDTVQDETTDNRRKTGKIGERTIGGSEQPLLEKHEEAPAQEPRKIWPVLGDTWQISFALFLNFVGTFCVFPGVFFADWVPEFADDAMNTQKWVPVLFTIFTCGDLVGRMLPNLIGTPKSTWVLPVVFLRFLLVVLGAYFGTGTGR